ISAFYPPYFTEPQMISMAQMDEGMDAGRYTFALYIPQGFQRDVLANRSPDLQLNVTATRMSQAFTGSGAVQQIVQAEIKEFLQRGRVASPPPVDLVVRARFNPSLEKAWFGSLMQVINYITMLSIVLTGAALIREREHGTIEHLLVMPVTPTEIMLAKIWSMGLVVLVASPPSVDLLVRAPFNPCLEKAWFGSLMQVINYITMLSIVLTGAALIREREHGTIEHLLVMPVTPTEIMLAKIWSMGLVVLV